MTAPWTESEAAVAQAHENGSKNLYNAIVDALKGRPVKSHGDLLWSHNPGTNSKRDLSRPYSREAQLQYERVKRLQEEKDAALSRIVNRDPCPLCAVRADVGCHHSRRRAA